MISEDVWWDIQGCLWVIEEEYDVCVLFVVEFGSCVWGFFLLNSDYDVCFIYVYFCEWYLLLDLEECCDVIECEIVDDIDFSGWDICKVLKLFWQFNLLFVEWLYFFIVYCDEVGFVDCVRVLLFDIYDVNKGVYYYWSMVDKNYCGYLKVKLVLLKKYFYVLCFLLVICWLECYCLFVLVEFECL